MEKNGLLATIYLPKNNYMIRLGLSILFFLFSLLVIFKAPTNLLWRATVALTEFPHLLMIASLLLLVSCYWAEKYKLSSSILSSIAFIIFSSTIFRTYNRASTIESELSANFSNENYGVLKNPLQTPFSFFTLFTGLNNNTIAHKSIVYKKTNALELSLDFYSSNTNEISPCIIIIHGGSWREGDSQQLPKLNSYFANRGYNVASINYRKAPEYTNPAPIEDTRDAINYIVENCKELKVDTSNFVLIGRSAGGQIALLSAYTLHNKNIKGVVSIYAPADMYWGAQHPGNKWVLDTDKVLGDFVGGSVKDFPEKYKQSSPVEFVDRNSTPTLIIHGQHDCMVSFLHSEHLQQKLVANKVKNYFLDLPWATHGCDFNISGPSGQTTTYAIERFINSVLSE